MFRTTIRATDKTDASTIVAKFCRDATRAGVATSEISSLSSELETALTELTVRGRQMASIGSQVEAKKIFALEGVELQLFFTNGSAPSVLQRISGLLGKR